ncbi:hypothetical protein [Novosphingobium sp. SG707]|uniref:hypothetical protein n=1 Tax=Novosphingobium sp. SG707 TaxID=2586996 RepID=UPI0014453B44|nr:hypothetical protein [Novosphingobium sp. SG707]NKJ02973.1 hypothetical protein [Novosphingobium sp. SG707]
MLASAGDTAEEVLAKLHYDHARAAVPGEQPNPKRYRDLRQLYRTIGLLYEDPVIGRLAVTDLGNAVARWRPLLKPQNSLVLGRHAAQALAACQLRTPMREGRNYDEDVRVFPFAFIWRAMLALDFRISSDELNRAILKTRNQRDLDRAISAIREAREAEDISLLGDETVSEAAKNDRILVWMSWASFGWTLITDKRTSASGHYEIPPRNRRVLRDAASIVHRHWDFANEADYVRYISANAGLPKDLR